MSEAETSTINTTNNSNEFLNNSTTINPDEATGSDELSSGIITTTSIPPPFQTILNLNLKQETTRSTTLKSTTKQYNKHKGNTGSGGRAAAGDKTEKPPHTYISLIAKAIQVCLLKNLIYSVI